MRAVWIQACVASLAGAGIGLAVAGCSFQPGAALEPVDGGVLPNSYACMCTCSESQANQAIAVSASRDDAEEGVTSSTMNLTDADLNVTGNGTEFVGMRFRNVMVPPGATLLSAFVQFTSAENDPAGGILEFIAENDDNAAGFNNTDGNLSTRPETPPGTEVDWNPGAWTLDEASSAERTPDLSGFLNQVVSRSGWMAGNSLVVIVRGNAHRLAYAFDGDPTKAPQLILTYSASGSSTVTLQTCVPDAFNPNLDGGVVPDAGDLQNDCSTRVAKTLGYLNKACNYPSTCSCNAVDVTSVPPKYSASCASSCTEVDVTANCSNFDPQDGGMVTATNAPGDQPVCIAHSPITSELFGQKSLCDVSGTVSFHSDDDSASSHTFGTIEFDGTPCPGQSCTVGMTYQLDANPMTFEKDFESATFSQLASVGETPLSLGAVLAADGTGQFGTSSTSSVSRGVRDSDQLAVLGSNIDPIDVAMVWGSTLPSCAVNGTLVGSIDGEIKKCTDTGDVCLQDSDCSATDCDGGPCACVKVGNSNTTLSLNVSGTLVNQPPTISAGPDQTVECNQSGGALFTLSALASDADNNATDFAWFVGPRPGKRSGSVRRFKRSRTWAPRSRTSCA